MQSRLESLIENNLNVLSGLLLSIFIVQPIVFDHYNIVVQTTENIQIGIIFTIVSIVRGYIWRRFFNKRLKGTL
jgi:hypothetical protein